MNHISKEDIIRYGILVFLTVISWFAQQTYEDVKEIEARLRSVEKNQAAIMARIGVEQASIPVSTLHGASKK